MRASVTTRSLRGGAFSALLPLGQLRGAAAPGQQPFPVALDHARRLPPTRLQDGRQLDAAGDHILNRPDPRAVPGQGAHDLVEKPSTSRHPLVDARHLARVQFFPYCAILPSKGKRKEILPTETTIDKADGEDIGWRCNDSLEIPARRVSC